MKYLIPHIAIPSGHESQSNQTDDSDAVPSPGRYVVSVQFMSTFSPPTGSSTSGFWLEQMRPVGQEVLVTTPFTIT